MSFSLEAVLVYTFESWVIWITFFFLRSGCNTRRSGCKESFQLQLSSVLFFGLGIYGSSLTWRRATNPSSICIWEITLSGVNFICNTESWMSEMVDVNFVCGFVQPQSEDVLLRRRMLRRFTEWKWLHALKICLHLSEILRLLNWELDLMIWLWLMCKESFLGNVEARNKRHFVSHFFFGCEQPFKL